MRTLARAILGVGVICLWIAAIRAGRPESYRSLEWYLVGGPVCLWLALPFAAVEWELRRATASRVATAILLAAAITLLLGTLVFQALGLLSDLVFVFLPIYGLLAMTAFAAAAQRRLRRESGSPGEGGLPYS